MGKLARRRLVRDFRILQSDPPHGVSGSPVNNDLLRWQAVIFGPEDTPWEGGTFRLELLFNDDYPNKPPHVRFLTRVFHPNVYMDGNICLDILQHQWSPIYDISAILTSIQSLLSDPNPSSPANSEAASLYSENRREYNRRILQCVTDSWKAVEVGDDHTAASASTQPPVPQGHTAISTDTANNPASSIHNVDGNDGCSSSSDVPPPPSDAPYDQTSYLGNSNDRTESAASRAGTTGDGPAALDMCCSTSTSVEGDCSRTVDADGNL